jgi:DNA polymerase (family 10)
MPVHNAEIADAFNEVADLLEIKSGNPFRIRAYRNAARTIGGLSQAVVDLIYKHKDLSELPGIGHDLAGKITELVETGKFPVLEEIRAHTPPHIRELLKVPGLGPKRVAILSDKLKIECLADLKAAAEKGVLKDIAGFGFKTEQKILAEVDQAKQTQVRFKWIVADEIARSLVDYLKNTPGVQKGVVAGSYRRKKETVGDLDIVVACKESAEVMNRFVQFEEVKDVLSHGATRSSVILRSGLQVDLRAVPQESYGAALHYFTGSKAHNIAIRTLGLKRGLKINEYGVFRGEKQIAGRTEEEVYAQVGLPYVEPELREDWGEIEAAQSQQLPHLVSLSDIRGDLHCHTSDSDGRCSLEEMAEAASTRGYEYIAITDHSKHVAIVHGLDPKRLLHQIKRIDKLNEKLKGLRLLKSVEVDILEDGSLDLPDDILRELDLVVCSVHFKFNLPAARQTERIIRAMDNLCFNILAHPTGRLIDQRRPYELNLEKVLHAARQRGCILEVNAQPDRLDLPENYCKMAKELGLKLVISTDAHCQDDLDFMRFGVGQARRGWLEASDVINTRPLTNLQKLLKRY